MSTTNTKKSTKAANKKVKEEPTTSTYQEDVEVNVEEEVSVKSQTTVNLETKVEQLTDLVNTLLKRIEILENKIVEQPTTSTKTTSKKEKEPKEPKEDKKPRAPSAYNIYMKEKMAELKETHPDLNNIERMKMAAEEWSKSKK
jgi:uncharacterized membrane protein